MTNENDLIQLPYFVHESDMERFERTNKRLWIIVLVLIVALIGTNGYWIWNESQYEDAVATQTVTQDSGDGGTNNFTGDFIGGDNYGETDDNNNG